MKTLMHNSLKYQMNNFWKYHQIEDYLKNILKYQVENLVEYHTKSQPKNLLRNIMNHLKHHQENHMENHHLGNKIKKHEHHSLEN